MSAAAVAAGAMAVESQNVVGVDSSYQCGDGYSFASGPFSAVGANTFDIQNLQIPGAEWDGVVFSIWEGDPSTRAGSELFYHDATDYQGEGTQEVAYWADENNNKVDYSVEAGQAFVLENAAGYELQFAGQVPTTDVTITCGDGYSMFGNPFPAEIDIQSIQIPGAEWDGVVFSIWEGDPSTRAGSELFYHDATDYAGEGTQETAYWADENNEKVSYPISIGQGFVLENASGYDVTIAKPYSL